MTFFQSVGKSFDFKGKRSRVRSAQDADDPGRPGRIAPGLGRVGRGACARLPERRVPPPATLHRSALTPPRIASEGPAAHSPPPAPARPSSGRDADETINETGPRQSLRQRAAAELKFMLFGPRNRNHAPLQTQFEANKDRSHAPTQVGADSTRWRSRSKHARRLRGGEGARPRVYCEEFID